MKIWEFIEVFLKKKIWGLLLKYINFLLYIVDYFGSGYYIWKKFFKIEVGEKKIVVYYFIKRLNGLVMLLMEINMVEKFDCIN